MALRKRVVVLTIAVALLAGACGTSDEGANDQPGDEEVSLALGSVPSTVEGNVVTIPVTVEGVDIIKPDGDDSGDSGHFHIFVDKEPVAVGETMPKERGIVHSADNPIKIWGLEPGEHEFTVVLGNGVHERIEPGAEESVTVDVKGPSVWGTVPATIEKDDDAVVDLASEGVEIVKADGASSKESGHYHVLVDPKVPPVAGEVIAPPEDGKIFHTFEESVTIEGLETGEHIIWVVLGDGLHEAFDPPVMDKRTITVG